MQNGGHSATGVCTGSAAIAAWTWTVNPVMPLRITITLWATGILLTAGAAILPDIDHPKSTMAASAGVATGVLAHIAASVSATVYAHTRAVCDPPPEKASNSHRGLIHTWQFAVLCGLAAWWGAAATRWAVPVVYLLVFAPAIRSLAWTGFNAGIRWNNPIWRHLSRGADPATKVGVSWLRKNLKWRKPIGAFVAAALVVGVLWTAGGLYSIPPLLLGILITVGMLTHDAGDGLTKYGVPWKAGIPHRCDRHREEYLAKACHRRIPLTRIALVRWRWHTCPRCVEARRHRGKRCAMWDRNTNVPDKLVFTTGKSRKETAVTYGSLAAGAGIIAASFLWL